MNSEIHNLIDRPYQEIVDDILTSIVGGVVNEPILFDVKTDLYPLAESARDIRAITGTVDRQRHAFQMDIDFSFSEGDNAVVWLEEGQWPDDETTFYVDYFRRDTSSPLSDINVGSVTRTLSEAIGREIATVYQQINLAWLSGFIDTAEGKSLDLVVSILGITRKTKDYAVGLVTFFRDPNVPGNITIPQNIRLATGKEEVIFQTTEPRTLQRGQVRIDVPVRAADGFKGDQGRVAAGAINTMVQPIAGIASLQNFEETFLGADDESDVQLRDRARAVLRSLGKATLASLRRVVAESHSKVIEIQDPNSPPVKKTAPGSLVMLIEAEPERFASLRAAVDETRAAGVLAGMLARYIYFKPRMVVQIQKDLTQPGKDKLINEIIAALQSYVDGLSSGQAAEGKALLKAVSDIKEVKKAAVVDVLVWRTDLTRPGDDVVVDSLLSAIEKTPAGDREALRAELSRVLTAEMTPLTAARRVADRSLLRGPDGQQAGDDDIDKADFSVVATIDQENWWLVLDMQAADIALMES